MDNTARKTTQRLIIMAVSLLGDSRKVSDHMAWSSADFLLYCTGEKEPSWPDVEKLTSLIINEQGLIIAQNRAMVAALREKFGDVEPT